MDHETEETTSEPSQSQPLSYAQVSDPNEELSPSSASRDLFDTSPQSRKQPPLSPAKSDNSKPKQQRASSVTATHDLAFKFLYTAAKQAGIERKKLMTTIPGPQYYQIFTWFNGPHSVGCRLDRFYTLRAWRSRIARHTCSPFAYSDHHLIKLQVTFRPTNPRGRGVWKLNTQLLKNESFCAAVNSFWPSWKFNKPAFTDPRVWWDAGKLQLKEIAIAHSVAEARERKRDKLNLEIEFRNILARGTSDTADNHVRLAEIRDLLKAIEDRNVEGAIIRSREQWLEFGEKPTKYFYQLEKQRQTRNSINELRVGDQTVTSHKNILTACRDFYVNLYTAE
ncbi:unnamed protein product, partial [Porites evermanni]